MKESSMLNVSVISPEKILFEGQAQSVVLPGSESNFAVLPGHVNLIGELQPGLLTIKMEGSELKYIINGGFVEVKENSVSALVEDAILPAEVDTDSELKSLNAQISRLISPEERDFVENEIAAHRARINYSEKKQ